MLCSWREQWSWGHSNLRTPRKKNLKSLSYGLVLQRLKETEEGRKVFFHSLSDDEKKRPDLILRLRPLMNLKCTDPRLSYPVLNGLWIGLRDFSVPAKLTRTFLLYWGRILFNFNAIYLFFVLLKPNPKHVLINAAITRLNILEDSFLREIFSEPLGMLWSTLWKVSFTLGMSGTEAEFCKPLCFISVTQ